MPRSNRPRATNNLPAERYQGRASFATEPPSKEKRKAMVEETLGLVPHVLASMGITQEQSNSTFYLSQLERLDDKASPGHTIPNIKVRYGDTFSLTRQLPKSRPDYLHKTAVLNCASDVELAGGWRHRFGTTQEDALCYSSTLWPTLDQWRQRYPWRTVVERNSSNNPGECAGIFSPQVVIFKDELANSCETLAKRDWTTVSVVSVAALACPPLVPDQTSKRKAAAGREMRMKLDRDVTTIRERFRMALRMAASQGKSVLLLAALGCGVWKCPPKQVAELLQECLGETEFEGWFREIWIGIYDEAVFGVWREVFKDDAG